jgi:hypothetical protein
MDVREFYQTVVEPNYDEFVHSQNDFRLLCNVVLSMNTVPEFLVLHRRGYAPDIPLEVLDEEAKQIRKLDGLMELNFCAIALKHVRKIRKIKGSDAKFKSTASSTGILPDDQSTWFVGKYDLVEVVRKAFATLQAIPELD